MATIKQVSELAGVSSATVSRVINKTGVVKEKTYAKVVAAMEELGYRHNVIAASLATNQTNTVGYVVPELHGSFFGAMMSGSEGVLREANKHMFIAAGHSNEAMEKQAIDVLLSRRCDALILHVEAVSDEYLIDLEKQDVPIVVVNRSVDAIRECCIAMDNKTGGYLATQHLIEQGHTSIAYISGPMFKADARDRLNGHQQALEEYKLSFSESLLYEGSFRLDSGIAGMQALLSQEVPFTAVVCANDEMAAGALNYLHRNNYRVPGEVSVVGFDNIEFSSYLTPALTTIDYPMQQIGEMAARHILNRAYRKTQFEIVNQFKPELIKRDSVQYR